jgi:hypothetical protein
VCSSIIQRKDKAQYLFSLTNISIFLKCTKATALTHRNSKSWTTSSDFKFSDENNVAR